MIELVDLVSFDDTVLKTVSRDDAYALGLKNCRVVNGFLMNSKGELWIPRRSPGKKLFSSCLDASVGGHVIAGETYEEAIKRETMEELRINLHDVEYVEAAYLTPQADRVSAFMKVYLIFQESTPNFNREDMCEGFWIFPNDLYQRLQTSDACKSDLRILCQKVFFQRA